MIFFPFFVVVMMICVAAKPSPDQGKSTNPDPGTTITFACRKTERSRRIEVLFRDEGLQRVNLNEKYTKGYCAKRTSVETPSTNNKWKITDANAVGDTNAHQFNCVGSKMDFNLCCDPNMQVNYDENKQSAQIQSDLTKSCRAMLDKPK